MKSIITRVNLNHERIAEQQDKFNFPNRFDILFYRNYLITLTCVIN